MNIQFILSIFSYVLLGTSLIGLLYSSIKNKKKGIWLGLLVAAFFIPLALFLLLVEDTSPPVDEYGQPAFEEPVVNKSGQVIMKAGKYVVGESVTPGTYDVEIDNKFGDITLIGADYTKTLIQRLGLDGIKKIRLTLENDDELSISDQAILTPVTEDIFAYEEGSFYPGIWYIGKEITPGRYTIFPTTKTVGEVKMYELNNTSPIADGYLGEGQDPSAVTMDLNEGNWLLITNMNFDLIPSTE